ncbi:hypothetical protein IVG45_09645 [Methylomonas sp. LL1]|uniref:hypothetical protein n=1 Tax=Methylomonas TaxID=416 RepID=UPI000ABD5942|nr:MULTISPECIES: hypothetical protein [Methylomonas]QPK65167.1 hypothetical protein IVG45_09645 [Methylomonas sp. LL1]
MASKVKDTPVLHGKDAQRFNQKMREATQKAISKQEYDRMMAVFKSVRIVES